MWTTNTFQHQDFVDLQANVNVFSPSITFASFEKGILMYIENIVIVFLLMTIMGLIHKIHPP